MLPDMGQSADEEFSDSDEEGRNGEEPTAAEGKTVAKPKPFPPRICLHSFSAPLQTLHQYITPPSTTRRYPSKVYFSFSTTINAREHKGHLGKVEETIKAVPEDAVLVESDLHTAGRECDEAVESAARFVCGIRGWGLEEGMGKLGRNWERFVGRAES